MPSRRIAEAPGPETPNSRVSPSVASETMNASSPPQPLGLRDHFHQRARIAQAEVEPLPGNGVNAMRRIADQRQPVFDDLCGVMEAERIG